MKFRIALLEDEIADIAQAASVFESFVDSCEFHLLYIGEDEVAGTPKILRHVNAFQKGDKNDIIPELQPFTHIVPFVLPQLASSDDANQLKEQIINYFLQNKFDLKFFDQRFLPFANKKIPGTDKDWNGADILVELLYREKQITGSFSESFLYTDATGGYEAAVGRLFSRFRTTDESLKGFLRSRSEAVEKGVDEFKKWLQEKISNIIISRTSLLEIYDQLWRPKAWGKAGKYGLYQVTHSLDDVKDLSEPNYSTSEMTTLQNWWNERLAQAREDCKILRLALHYDEERMDYHLIELEKYFNQIETYVDALPPQIPFTGTFKHGGDIEKFKKLYRFSLDSSLGVGFGEMVRDIVKHYANVSSISWSMETAIEAGFFSRVDEIARGLNYLFESIFTNGKPNHVAVQLETHPTEFVLTIKDDSQINMPRQNFFNTGNKMPNARRYLKGYCQWFITANFGIEGAFEHNVYHGQEDTVINSPLTGVEQRLVFKLPDFTSPRH